MGTTASPPGYQSVGRHAVKGETALWVAGNKSAEAHG